MNALKKGDVIRFRGNAPVYQFHPGKVVYGRFLGACQGNPCKSWVVKYPTPSPRSGNLFILDNQFFDPDDHPGYTPEMPRWGQRWDTRKT